ncbi:MAG: trigger factor [Pseudanabaenaceae cyanobacterium bins.68]|nr:trigger factor [Pseudanabaenaceae cyanobacterium bins.68]
MKVTIEQLPASQVGFEIEIDGSKSQAVYDRTVQKIIKNAEIPGFRKGKAPKQLILNQFGKTQLKANVLEDLIEECLTQAVKDYQDQIKVIGQFELDQKEEVFASFEIGQPFTLKAKVDVMPEPKLGQYTGLEVKAEQVEPKLEEVDRLLRSFQIRRSTLVPVEDRPAQADDVVSISYTMADKDSGLIFAEQTVENSTFTLPSAEADDQDEIDELPEIIAAVPGMAIAETKDLEFFLDPEEWDQPMAGKTVVFRITLNELKVRELPELDDEFAQAISEKQTMAELRQYLEERTQEEAASKTQLNTNDAIMSAVLAQLEVDIPQVMLDQEVNNLIRQQIDFLSQKPELRPMLNQVFTRENLPQIRETNLPEAIARIRRSFALDQIAKIEKIEPDPVELEQELAQALAEMEDAKNADPEEIKELVHMGLVNKKVYQFLQENNRVKLVPEGTLEDEAQELIAAEATVESIAQEVVEPVLETPRESTPAVEPVLEAAAELETQPTPAPKTAKSKKSPKSNG